MSASQSRITMLGELKRLPEDAVLMSEKKNRKYGGGRLIRVALPGQMYGVDGRFTLHKEMRRNLPAVVLHNPAAPPVSDTTAATITPQMREAVISRLRDHVVKARVRLPGDRGMSHVYCECSPEVPTNGPDGREWREHVTDAVLAALGLTVTSEVEG